jgi:hypothetical protein
MVANALTTGELLMLSHTTSVIADGGSMARISSSSVDTGGATNGVLLDLISSGSTAGTQFLQTYSALTTGTGQRIAANALTSGTLLDIGSNGTGGLTGQKGLNILMTGANGTGAQTTYSAYIANTHSGTTSTNVALYATATGGTTANYAAIFQAGNVGIGTTLPASALEVAAAGTLAIPQGTAPTVSKAGHIAVDTTGDQLLYYGTAERVLTYEDTRCGYFADLLSTDDQISMGAWSQPVTITGVGCTYVGIGTTTATITLENGSATAMTITGTNPTCTANSSAFTFAAVTASNALTAGQVVRFNVTNTPVPSTDDYTICVRYVYTRQ